MNPTVTITRAVAGDARAIAEMVGELLVEIMDAIGERAFHFDLEETVVRLTDFLGDGKYVVFVARGSDGDPAGFVALYESFSLYAEGAFGTIPELYVRPLLRNAGLGLRLVAAARAYGAERGWTRLEVTTPPLPQFGRTLAFYEREGFSISGGRKLKLTL